MNFGILEYAAVAGGRWGHLIPFLDLFLRGRRSGREVLEMGGFSYS